MGIKEINKITYQMIFEQRFSIKEYQREFVWDSTDVDDLLLSVNDDLFYGIGTYTIDNNAYEIIDGQQRLTSIAMIAGYKNNDAKLKIDFNLSKTVEGDVNNILNWNCKDELAQSKTPSYYTKKLEQIKIEVILRLKDVRFLKKIFKKCIEAKGRYSIEDHEEIIKHTEYNEPFNRLVKKKVKLVEEEELRTIITERIERIENIFESINSIKKVIIPVHYIPKSKVHKTFIAMNSKGKHIDDSLYFKQLILGNSIDTESSVSDLWSDLLNYYYKIKDSSDMVKIKDLISQAHDSICKEEGRPDLSVSTVVKKYKSDYRIPKDWNYSDAHLSIIKDHVKWASDKLVLNKTQLKGEELATSDWIPSVYRFDNKYFPLFVPLIYQVQRYCHNNEINGNKDKKCMDKLNVIKMHIGMITFMSTYIPKELMPSKQFTELVDEYLLFGTKWLTNDKNSNKNIDSFIKETFNLINVNHMKELIVPDKVAISSMKYLFSNNPSEKGMHLSNDLARLYLSLVYALSKESKLDYSTYLKLIKKTWRTNVDPSIEHVFNENNTTRVSDCLLLKGSINKKLDDNDIKAKKDILTDIKGDEFTEFYKDRIDDLDLDDKVSKVIKSYRDKFDIKLRGWVVNTIKNNKTT